MVKAYLIDMDGVLVRGSRLVPGADGFIKRLQQAAAPFLVLTNNPSYTPHDLRARLAAIGLAIPAEAVFTSAMATAQLLHQHSPRGKACVIGDPGLTTAMHEAGYVVTDRKCGLCRVGPAQFLQLSTHRQGRAFGHRASARFIAANPDVSALRQMRASCLPPGRWRLEITTTTGIKPYFIGKPKGADDAVRPASTRNTFGRHRNDRRPDGHRHRGRHPGRPWRPSWC